MKLATYNPGVAKTTTGNVRVNAPGDGGAAQAALTIGRMQGQSMQGLANTIQAATEQIDAVNVQAASNEYTRRLNEVLYNQDNGLMNTKYQQAEGITQKFQEEERKIRQEVGRQYNFLSLKGGSVFNRMTDNSAAQRFEMVRKHQTQQFNAYKDVTYENGIQMNLQTAADNYGMADVVDDNIKEAILSTRARLFGQGEEVIKAAERKVTGQIAAQVINRAYANGDTDSAESYIERYGRYMDPATVTGYAKNVHASRMAALNETTAKSLLARFGDNEEAAYNYINSAEFNGSGNSDSSVAWFKDMADRGQGWGVNTCTKGVNAALMAGGYKPIPLWAPTAWEEADDAGRTFKNRNQLRNGDIVYWDSAGDKDASHVGIYDAKTGKVYQSGTSGFRAIDLDAYPLIGFSRPQGKAATPEERKKLYAAYREELGRKKRFEAQADQRIVDAVTDKFFELKGQGITDPGTYRAAVSELAGDNTRVSRRLMEKADNIAAMVGKASGSTRNTGNGTKQSSSVSPLFKPEMTQLMLKGMSNDDIAAYMNDPERRHMFNDKANAIVLELMQDRAEGKGAFAYDWEGLKPIIMQGYRGASTNKDAVWGSLQNLLIYKINEYRADNNGRDPSKAEVQQMAASLTIDQAVQMEQAGIYDWHENGDMVDIVIKNDRGNGFVRRRLTKDQLEMVRRGTPVRTYTGEDYYGG